MRRTFPRSILSALGAFSLLILLAIAPVAGSEGGSGSVSITQGQTVHIGETGLDLTAALNTAAGYGPVNTTPNYTTIGWWPGGESAGTSAPAVVLPLVARYSAFEVSPPDFIPYLGNWYLLGPDAMTPLNSSVPLFRVAFRVDQGQVIHIDDSGLDLRAAFNSAAGNGPVFTTPDYKTIGWWPPGMPVGSSAPAKVISLHARYSFLTVSGADFFDYFGDWYLLDEDHMRPVNNSAPVFRVAVRVNQGQTVHIGENGLDLTQALNGAAGNYPFLDPPTNLVIGWWPDEASRSTTTPAQKIYLNGRHTSFTVAPVDFQDYLGGWYLVDPGTMHAVTTHGPVFRVAVRVTKGQTVHIGETGLDLTQALNGAAGNYPFLDPPTNLVIGWWPDESSIGSTSPAKILSLDGRYSFFTISPADFYGYFGNWYVLDESHTHPVNNYGGPAFRVAVKVKKGQAIHFNETGLDVTQALNEAAGNYPFLERPALTTVGWWANPASITNSAPTKLIELDGRYSSLTVTPAEFRGFTGDWYLLTADRTIVPNNNGPVFRVTSQVSQGQTIRIGETNLDLTQALNNAAGNYPFLEHPTLTTVGWWASPASITNSAPTKLIELDGRYSSFNVTSAEFSGFAGDWYLLGPDWTIVPNNNGPVFRLQ